MLARLKLFPLSFVLLSQPHAHLAGKLLCATQIQRMWQQCGCAAHLPIWSHACEIETVSSIFRIAVSTPRALGWEVALCYSDTANVAAMWMRGSLAYLVSCLRD